MTLKSRPEASRARAGRIRADRIRAGRAFTPSANYTPQVRVENGHGTGLERLAPDGLAASTAAAVAAAVRAGTAAPKDRPRQAELLDDVRTLPGTGPRAQGGTHGRNSSEQRWSTHAIPAR